MALRLVRTPPRPATLGLVVLLAIVAVAILTTRSVLAPPPAAPQGVIRQVQPAQSVDQVPPANPGSMTAPDAQPAQGTTKLPPGPPNTQPIVSNAPPSSDGVDGGGGRIANVEPGGNSGICTATKDCK